MTDVAERSRRARARQRCGVSVFHLELNQDDLAAFLIEAKYLSGFDIESKPAITDALQRLIQALLNDPE